VTLDDDWFRVEDLGEGVRCLSEPGYANMFLVEGRDRAVLFDTGIGVRDLAAVVSRLTALPLTVVNSHAHFDHRGGNHRLVDRAEAFLVHPAGPAHHHAVPAELLDATRTASAGLPRALSDARAADALHALPADLRMRAIDDATVQGPWQIPEVAPTGVLEDGEPLDLGGRVLRAVHTPGHTEDSLCLFEEATGLLLAGDCVLESDYFVHLPGADPERFAASLRRLEGLPIRRVAVGHNVRPTVRPEMIGLLRRALEEVTAGRTPDDTITGPYGVRTSRHAFDGFRLLMPPTDGVQTPAWDLWR